MPGVLHRATTDVFVDASTVDLVGESLVAEFEPDWTLNGLAEAASDTDADCDTDSGEEGIHIVCGQEIGTVPVTCELWDHQPPLAPESWQDIAEISAHWASTFLGFGIGTTGQDDVPDSRLPIRRPGTCRFRVHGVHRDGDDPRPDTAARETYLVQL
ncbi:hypothetical protein AV521_19255 [Streptomyces sp. IMTB 2501]|uniref:hypothetical protein n=1 Tax=Streptomyces sp. IMTB 2501 TaxID=1776340 RepID=UPI00096E77D6|nr:hypothetical protein [Streptomyces sp. IMTB 2501]OLZ68926.1 hypothetical protein AV521_19255 [Streptomyces sp. IMTB 2501]